MDSRLDDDSNGISNTDNSMLFKDLLIAAGLLALTSITKLFRRHKKA